MPSSVTLALAASKFVVYVKTTFSLLLENVNRATEPVTLDWASRFPGETCLCYQLR